MNGIKKKRIREENTPFLYTRKKEMINKTEYMLKGKRERTKGTVRGGGRRRRGGGGGGDHFGEEIVNKKRKTV